MISVCRIGRAPYHTAKLLKEKYSARRPQGIPKDPMGPPHARGCALAGATKRCSGIRSAWETADSWHGLCLGLAFAFGGFGCVGCAGGFTCVAGAPPGSGFGCGAGDGLEAGGGPP